MKKKLPFVYASSGSVRNRLFVYVFDEPPLWFLQRLLTLVDRFIIVGRFWCWLFHEGFVCLAVIRDWCLGLFLFMFWEVYTCYATGSDGFRCWWWLITVWMIGTTFDFSHSCWYCDCVLFWLQVDESDEWFMNFFLAPFLVVLQVQFIVWGFWG